jgi:hypothetical protein
MLRRIQGTCKIPSEKGALFGGLSSGFVTHVHGNLSNLHLGGWRAT